MALGERFRSTGSSAVAGFLAEHQGCDAGFDVTRDQGPGSGRLKITCKGCGETVEYRAADAAETAVGPPLDNGDAQPLHPAPDDLASPSPSPIPSGRRPVPRVPSPRRSVGLPAWLPVLLIAAVILAGIGLIVAGVLRSGDDSGSEGGTASSGQAEESRPAAPQEEPAPTTSDPTGGPAPTGSDPAGGPAPQAVVLRRERFVGRFAIGVPQGWSRAVPGGNVVLTAREGVAQIRVFSDSPATDPDQLAGPTADYLESQHPGASVSKPRRVRFGGGRAIQLRASYQTGEEIATVVSAGGFSFLVTYRKGNQAPAQVVEKGDAAYASFRPRR